MSKKRLFQVFDEMNVNDDKNKTATLGCCFDMVEAKTVKAGGIVTMGVPKDEITKIFLGERQPILLLMDRKEYRRLEAIPVEDKLQAAEEKAARYEKALIKIVSLSCKVDSRDAILELKSIASMAVAKEQETLTPKTSEDGR